MAIVFAVGLAAFKVLVSLWSLQGFARCSRSCVVGCGIPCDIWQPTGPLA